MKDYFLLLSSASLIHSLLHLFPSPKDLYSLSFLSNWNLEASSFLFFYSLKVSFHYLPPFLLLLFPFHHLNHLLNEWTMLSESAIIFIFLLFFNCITQVSSSHKIIQISLYIHHLHRGHHSGNRSLYLPPSSWWCY